METFAQEVRVLVGHRLVRGAVDDDRVKQMILFYQTDQAPQVERLFCLIHLGLPVFQVQAVDVGQQRPGIRDPADAQVDVFLLKPFLLTLHLLQQRAADAAHANQEQLDNLIGVEQHLVNHTNAGGGIVVIHNNRN